MAGPLNPDVVRDWQQIMADAEAYRNKWIEINLGGKKRCTISPLGFQPFAITSMLHSNGDNVVAITDYFGEAVIIALFRRSETELGFTHCTWINDATGSDSPARLFHDIDPVKKANRPDTVLFDPVNPRHIIIGRNARRELYRLAPPDETRGWSLEPRLIHLAGEQTTTNWALSRCFTRGGSLYVLEGTRDNKRLCVRRYMPNQSGFQFDEDGIAIPAGMLPDGLHGMTLGPDGILWFLTRYKADMPLGVYAWDNGKRELNRIVPNVWGSGLTRLANGDLLIARYGLDDPGVFRGRPGALIWIHADAIKK